ncbi:MAG TPA: hypothetical protein VE953_03060 [Terriglobales bacterium]|nr:hypothetical protein [Terriglobales bacterium]
MPRALCLGALLLAAACGQGGAGPSAPAAVHASAPAATGGPDLAAWQRKGATEAPPPSVGAASLGGVQVVNQTGGAVSDADATRWALAYVRANAYEFWAWNHLQDGFLQSAQLSPVPERVFAYDLSAIRDARAAGVRLEVTRLVLRRLVLRAVPASLRSEIQRQVFVYAPYAFYLDQIGPSELDWIDARGVRTSRARRDAGVGAPELVGGQLATDPLMGDIWVVDSDFDCTSPNVRQAFGSLCSQ